MRYVISILLLTFFLNLPASIAADRSVGSIELFVNPVAIPADGKSVCTITARVRDREGNFVPDGTEIRFSASLGIVEETGITSSGVARVKLTSADIPGTSIVTATWLDGSAVAQVSVTFGESAEVPKGPQYIQLESDGYLAYSADYKVVEALGNAKLSYRSLKLEADIIQVDVGENRIVAKAMTREKPVRIQGSSSDILGDIFACRFDGDSGLLLSSSEGLVQKVDLCTPNPQITVDEPFYSPEDFEVRDVSDSSILVKGRAATIFPNEKIQFRGAQVYIDGKRIISLPLYVLWLTDYQPEEERYVGYSTSGLTLNFPFYYSLTPSSSGAVLIRHGERTGWGEYGQKPGWFIDLRQKYTTEHSNGVFVLSQLTSSNWSAYFTHNQSFGSNAYGCLYLDYPSHRDLFASLNFTKSFRNLDFSFTRDQNFLQDAEDQGLTDISVRIRPKALGTTGLRYSLSMRSTYATNVHDKYEVRGSVYSPEIKLSPRLSIRSSLSLGYVWADPILTGLSTAATAVVDWSIGDNNKLSFIYRYSDKAVARLPQYSRFSNLSGADQQTLSVVWIISDKNRRWRASLYTIRALNSGDLSLFGDMSYRLSSDWRIAVRSTQNKYENLSYNDLELSLSKRIGNRELIAVWSKSQRKIMFELGSAVF
jgi:hypothetical protein